MADEKNGVETHSRPDTVPPGGVVGSAKLSSPTKEGPGMHATDLKIVRDELSNITRRLKLVEERIVSLRSKSTMIEDNIMNEKHHVDKEIKDVGLQIKENKVVNAQMRDDVLLIIKELQTLAKKDKVEALEKYIDLWSPIRYVSQTEVEKLIEDKVEEALKDMNLKIQEEKFIEELVERKLQERGT